MVLWSILPESFTLPGTASTRGAPGMSVRIKTIPLSGGAGFKRTVMFGNQILDAARQFVFAGQFQPGDDVLDDDPCTLLGRDILMGIQLPRQLVLHEKLGVLCFPDIVVQGTDPGKQAVGTNPLSSLFGQVSNLQAMLVGAGRIAQQVLQQGVIWA